MTVIFGDCQTAWDADSLRLIRERYGRPLEFSIPGSYPIPPVPCANPGCHHVRRRKKGRKGYGWEGLAGVNGYCATCTSAWYRGGKKDEHPPAPMTREAALAIARAAQGLNLALAEGDAMGNITAAQAARLAATMARMEDFCWLRECRVSLEEAAGRVGITLSTAEEYERKRLAGEINGHIGDDDEESEDLGEAA